MHPIERLRWIARADDEPAASLAAEAAWTLAELAEQEPSALLTACRRLLDRHPECGPLWWVSARLASSDDPGEAGGRAGAELCSDPTSDRLARALRASLAAGDVLVLSPPVELALAALESGRHYEVRLVGEGTRLHQAMRSLAVATSCEVTGFGTAEERAALHGAGVLVVEVTAAGGEAALVERGAGRVLRAARQLGVPTWAVVGVGRNLPETLFSAAAERAAEKSDRVPLEEFDLAIGPEETGEAAMVVAHVTCPAGPELLRRPI